MIGPPNYLFDILAFR